MRAVVPAGLLEAVAARNTLVVVVAVESHNCRLAVVVVVVVVVAAAVDAAVAVGRSDFPAMSRQQRSPVDRAVGT